MSDLRAAAEALEAIPDSPAAIHVAARARFEVMLELAGASLVEEAALPEGPGIFPEEVGSPGPWYGVRIGDEPVWGWCRQPEHLSGHLQHSVPLWAALDALIAARAALAAPEPSDVEYDFPAALASLRKLRDALDSATTPDTSDAAAKRLRNWLFEQMDAFEGALRTAIGSVRSVWVTFPEWRPHPLVAAEPSDEAVARELVKEYERMWLVGDGEPPSDGSRVGLMLMACDDVAAVRAATERARGTA